MENRRSLGPIAGIAIFFTLFFLPIPFRILADYIWFSSLDYASVFATVFFTKIWLFFLFAAAAAIVYFPVHLFFVKELKVDARQYWIIGATLSLLSGVAGAGFWNRALLFLNSTSFGVTDPVFTKDVAFHVFTLPFLTTMVMALIIMTLVTIISLVVIAVMGTPTTMREVDEFGVEYQLNTYDPTTTWKMVIGKPRLLWSGSILLGLLGLLVSFSVYLSRFSLLFSQRGAVFGAAFTDVSVSLPLINILTLIAAILALSLFGLAYHRNPKIIGGVVILFLGVAIIGNVGATLVQSYVVSPDEFNKENEFIQRNIEFTDLAYGLNKISESAFELDSNLTAEDLDRNPGTVKNIRVWDWRPLLTTYNELQIFRTYYNFLDVDIDRYTIDDELIQLMVSPREMDIAALPLESQTWVNRHLVYTHGYGIVASPMNEISTEGLPALYIKDIPPKSDLGLDITRPEIYFGENTRDYVIVRTSTQELDYPSGDQNVYTRYEGSGGIAVSPLVRLAFALKFADAKLLFSGSVDQDSRLMLNRDIRTRVNTLAPFLTYDKDPYMVLADGKLYWIYDAYTTTNRYPYSEPLRRGFSRINYIRNSVKVVIDAYSGETSFYSVGEDPIRDAYELIFPDLFKPLSKMPQSLRAHLRYPQDLFEAQTDIYLDYHMRDPKVFYNREDSWEIPKEVYRGTPQEVEPYYVIMSLPGSDREEFIQIQPFVPRGKQNLIGWMAARSDPPHYGELQTFLFSKQELAYGPLQVEARIDQDPTISQAITLWSSAGSAVIRGNLIALPLENSILYIEPLFLISTQEGTLPQIKQVILVEGDKLTMQPDLKTALQALLGERIEQAQEAVDQIGGSGVIPGTFQALVDQALDEYSQAEELLRQGNLGGYAEKISLVQEILLELDRTLPPPTDN